MYHIFLTHSQLLKLMIIKYPSFAWLIMARMAPVGWSQENPQIVKGIHLLIHLQLDISEHPIKRMEKHPVLEALISKKRLSDIRDVKKIPCCQGQRSRICFDVWWLYHAISLYICLMDNSLHVGVQWTNHDRSISGFHGPNPCTSRRFLWPR